ncbi:hypothetical protein BDQ12DRAFT_672508 [Crucibulum laeve]|uniref:Uncharacterized protein n=1 Tax=Crucibulum laeve TaxID=68775 RepID=A0A5C3MFH4_9AGAR|nr:hypothetical protein BDQ12DRAFT_672508 [Crucibulum laeve]
MRCPRYRWGRSMEVRGDWNTQRIIDSSNKAARRTSHIHTTNLRYPIPIPHTHIPSRRIHIPNPYMHIPAPKHILKSHNLTHHDDRILLPANVRLYRLHEDEIITTRRYLPCAGLLILGTRRARARPSPRVRCPSPRHYRGSIRRDRIAPGTLQAITAQHRGLELIAEQDITRIDSATHRATRVY